MTEAEKLCHKCQIGESVSATMESGGDLSAEGIILQYTSQSTTDMKLEGVCLVPRDVFRPMIAREILWVTNRI